MRRGLPWFIGALLFAGLAWWPAPYNHWSLNLTSARIGLMLLGLLAMAAGLSKLTFWEGFLWVGAGLPVAALLRVAVEVAKDPTSHNLWPLELVMVGIGSVAVVFPALGVGRLVRLLLRARAKA
jgi:hypothetical protein